MGPTTNRAGEVVSEDEDTMASLVALDNQNGLFSKGGSRKMFPCFL